MSFTGSDDQELCDCCNSMCQPGMITPWPVAAGPVFGPDGRLTRDRRDSFGICQRCLQSLVLKASLPRDGRALARQSANRWAASQALLAAAERALSGRAA